jgi:hypothetical protein
MTPNGKHAEKVLNMLAISEFQLVYGCYPMILIFESLLTDPSIPT